MTDQRRQEVTDAIALARAGDRGAAYQLLRTVTDGDPSNAEAWLWLGGVTSDPIEQRVALERVIALDPGNTRAQRGLQALRLRNPGVFAISQPADAVVPAPVSTDRTDPAAESQPTAEAAPEISSPGPAIVSPAVELPASAPEATEQMAVVQLAAVADAPAEPSSSLDAELRCPYCGALTALEDVRCSHCQGELIVAADRGAGARVARLLLALLRLLAAAGAVAGSVWILGETQRIQAGTDHTFGPLVQQLGLAARTDAVLPLVSSIGLSLGGLALIGLIVAVGLVLRWRAMYIIDLLLVLAALVGGITLMVIAFPVVASSSQLDQRVGTAGLVGLGAVIAVAVAQLILSLASRREFFPRRERVRIPDQRLSGAEHFRLGTRFRDRGWRWAAARELERAADQEPQVLKYRRALAEVYASMGDHLRARDELRASLNLQPDLSPAARAGALAEEVQRGRQ